MRRFDLAVTCVCSALLGYFAWHAWKGPRGFPYQEELQVKVASLETTFEARQQERIRLEHKVGLLRPDSIDPDLLGELARRELDLVAPGDVTAFVNR